MAPAFRAGKSTRPDDAHAQPRVLLGSYGVRGAARDLSLAPHERVVYLFNPFTGRTLERCLDRIVASLVAVRRRGRECRSTRYCC